MSHSHILAQPALAGGRPFAGRGHVNLVMSEWVRMMRQRHDSGLDNACFDLVGTAPR